MSISLKIHQYKISFESGPFDSPLGDLFDREDLLKIRNQLNARPDPKKLFRNQDRIDLILRRIQAYHSLREATVRA